MIKCIDKPDQTQPGPRSQARLPMKVLHDTCPVCLYFRFFFPLLPFPAEVLGAAELDAAGAAGAAAISVPLCA